MTEGARSTASLPLEVVQIPLGAIGTNCYLLSRHGSSRALVVDPGADPERVMAALDERGLEAEAILVTHCHWDHIGGVAPLARTLGIPVYMSGIESPVLAGPTEFTPPTVDIEPWEVEHELAGGEELQLAGIHLQVLHLPGHSPGSLGFLVPTPAGAGDDMPPLLFVGDLIFAGSVGRTDLPFADHDTLLASCRLVLEQLPDTAILLSGHGPPTTVGRERGTNPFLRALE